MKVKKYVAKDMPEAMKIIRKELGQDAVILHKREVDTGGFFGFFTKKAIEVTAAVEPNPVASNSKNATFKQQLTIEQQQIKDNPSELSSVLESHQDNKMLNELTNKVEELTHSIKTLSAKEQLGTTKVPEGMEGIIHHLLNKGVNEAIVEKITDQLLVKWYQLNQNEQLQANQALFIRWLQAILKDLLKGMHQTESIYDSRIIALVGPTGVGKTTTLAKLAAAASLQDHKKVAFITTDTYRIAAIEQLKTYANILSVPVKVAYSIQDFKQAIEEFEDYDHIFVDTAGRNFLKKFYVDELAKIIDIKKDMRLYLVLSLTAKLRDMQATYNQFQALPINQLIFTKKDETTSYGDIVNMMLTNKLGVAYLTNGQNVPDDILPASIEEVIQLLIGDLTND